MRWGERGDAGTGARGGGGGAAAGAGAARAGAGPRSWVTWCVWLRRLNVLRPSKHLLFDSSLFDM